MGGDERFPTALKRCLITSNDQLIESQRFPFRGSTKIISPQLFPLSWLGKISNRRVV